ncbi:MAG: transcription-repair coupling factor, partial [Propylenella sp.]
MTRLERFFASDPLANLFSGRAHVAMGGVPEGLEGRILARLAEAEGTVLYVARDGRRLTMAQEALAFFAPYTPTLAFPAWDALPYDRVSPNPEVSANRMSALSNLLQPHGGPRVVFTTVNAIVQRVSDRESVKARAWGAAAGNVVKMEALARWLEANGFGRSDTVREVGEYAVRGGILDLWAPGTQAPVRLDFFGDVLESIRPFDPLTQRTTGQIKRLDLVPASEIVLTEETVARFRRNYRTAFGAVLENDPLFQAVSEGRRFAGMEHWLPFFYEELETLFDFLPDVPIIVGHLA